jgi:hypothetical protein
MRTFLQWLASLPAPAWAEAWLKKAGAYNDVPDNWAQTSHAALGYAVVFTFGVDFDMVFAPAIVLLVLIFFKEFWFDIRYEQNETIESSWKDWKFWAIGSLLGGISYAVWLVL